MLFRARHASRSWWPAAAALALAATAGLAAFGCNSTTAPAATSPYRADTSAENTIANVAVAYDRMDPVEVEKTISSDFSFRFASVDFGIGYPDSITRAEYLTYVQELFMAGTPCSVSKITLTLTPTGKQADARPGHTGWQKCTVDASAVFTFGNGDQASVVDALIWYFRQEPVGSGHWLLAEWQDQHAPIGGRGREIRTDAVGKVSWDTWGELMRFLASASCTAHAAPARR